MNSTRLTTRLHVIQALYQMDMTAIPLEDLLREFHPFPHDTEDNDNNSNPPPRRNQKQQAQFRRLLRDVVHNLDAVDAKLQSSLASGWRAERMDCTLRALLRAGLYEILFASPTPAKTISDALDVTLSAYCHLAESFFSSGQASLVRAVLQKAAQNRLSQTNFPTTAEHTPKRSKTLASRVQ